MEIKCLLKAKLAENGITLKTLSEKTGINYTYLSDLNRGKSLPSLEFAYRIAEVLNLRVEEIWIKKMNS